MGPHRVMYVTAIFLMFFLGQFLHAWLRAQASRNSSLNGIDSYRKYVEVYGAVLVSRFFLATCGLMAWAWYGDSICSFLAQYFPDYLGWAARNPVPLNPMTSGVYGFFGDSLIDFGGNLLSQRIPALGREVPIAPTAPEQNKP